MQLEDRLTQIKLLLLNAPDNIREACRSELEEIETLLARQNSQTSFLGFVGQVWPSFISGRHHAIMADAFERVARGELKRLIINMPPRHTKSEFASFLLPAWFLGQFPNKKVIQASCTADLAVGFGRKVRNLVSSPEYQRLFPGVALRQDSKAAGRWATSHDGEYFAIGVDGNVTGKGGDIFIIDDPHSEQQAQIGDYNGNVYDKVYEWYTSGPRQRLQPGAAIVVVMTRWHKRDLTGRLLKSSIETRGGDQWEVIELPAIMPSGIPMWPEFWPIDELLKTKAEISTSKWAAQYQQDPTSEEGAIIKRDWWREWEKRIPALNDCEAILQSWDTAYTKSERADYSACTTWAVVKVDDSKGNPSYGLLLLDAFREKAEFPDLKKLAMESYKKWEPDMVIVEKKAAGAPLIYELRAMGIPVTEFTPTRYSGDKIVRVNAITDLFASGLIWYAPGQASDDVIEECAAFPQGEHDDYVDTVSQALLRFRQGGFIRPESDEPDEPVYHRVADYY